MKVPEPFEAQLELLDAFVSGKYKYFLYGGGVSGGKSFLGAWLITGLSIEYPNSRFAVVRRNLSVLKRTTLKTFIKLLDNIGIDYNLNKSDLVITINQTGSTIEFIEADETKDPDFNKIKGLEVTGIMIDEANEIIEQAYSMALTRIGRWNENGCPMFIYLTCNPAQNWVKQKFYDPWLEDDLKPPYYFKQALPTDNPHNSDAYLETLEDLPDNEYNRYVLGDWGYNDDPMQLIKYEWLIANQTEQDDSHNVMGVDVARYGDDRTVYAFGNKADQLITKIQTYSKQDTVTTANQIIERISQYKIPSFNVAIDAIGIGGGPIDICKAKGYGVKEYKSSEKPNEKRGLVRFKNKRSQDYWQLREALQKGTISIIKNEKLYTELTNIRYIDKNKVIAMETKKNIKKRLGFSPDLADAVVILYSLMRRSGKQDVSTGQNILHNPAVSGIDKQYSEYGKNRTTRYSNRKKSAEKFDSYGSPARIRY